MRRGRSVSGAVGRYGMVGATVNLNLLVKKELESCTSLNPLRNTSSDVLVCSKSGGATSLEASFVSERHL